jgi:hypothetical protein
MVPLFQAGVIIMQAKSPQQFAEWLVMKGLTSEAVMDRFDRLVNRLL